MSRRIKSLQLRLTIRAPALVLPQRTGPQSAVAMCKHVRGHAAARVIAIGDRGQLYQRQPHAAKQIVAPNGIGRVGDEARSSGRRAVSRSAQGKANVQEEKETSPADGSERICGKAEEILDRCRARAGADKKDRANESQFADKPLPLHLSDKPPGQPRPRFAHGARVSIKWVWTPTPCRSRSERPKWPAAGEQRCGAFGQQQYEKRPEPARVPPQFANLRPIARRIEQWAPPSQDGDRFGNFQTQQGVAGNHAFKLVSRPENRSTRKESMY